MSRNDTDTLEQYKLARDALMDAINNGENVAEIEIRNRRVRYHADQLPFIERQIVRYAKLVDLASGTTTRNHARIRR